MSVQQGLPEDGLLLLAGPEPALDLSVVLKQPSGPASEGGPEPLRWEGRGARLLSTAEKGLHGTLCSHVPARRC